MFTKGVFMEPKICCFAGHSDIFLEDKIALEVKLKKEIINLIENEGVNTFYSGGKGDFDWLCAKCLHELQEYYPKIKSYLILAYMPHKKDDYTDDLYKKFDGTLYPDIEKIPPRFAILNRSEWMIDIKFFDCVHQA